MNSVFEVNGTDEIYCTLKRSTNSQDQEARDFVERLWKEVHSYLDPDLLHELPNQFHQRFWEMYLAASMREAGLSLDQKKSRDGPDICIKVGESRIWIEAVTASSGQGNDAVKKAECGVVRDVPDDQIKLRLLNAFTEKTKKYKQYLEKNWVNVEDHYIIAINAAQVPSARLEREIPRIVRCLLPFGDQVLHLDRETLELFDTSYEYQQYVTKASGSEIETTSFLNPEYSGVSAVIYSCVDVFQYPKEIGQSLLLFHNPLASNRLSPGFLKKGNEYWVDCHLRYKSWNSN